MGWDFILFHLPVAIKLNEVDKTLSKCIRCDTCDGYPCLVHAKGDAEVDCVRPFTGLSQSNFDDGGLK